jgi:RNA polymerase sigma-70 factor (ECF subfamily)
MHTESSLRPQASHRRSEPSSLAALTLLAARAPRGSKRSAPPPSQRHGSSAWPASHPSELRTELSLLRPELLARALRFARCPSRADDLVQDTMLRALRFEGQYRPGTNLRAWVMQILRSVFLTQCRRNRREQKALGNLLRDPCAWLHQDGPAAMGALSPTPARALASLASGYQEVVRLVDIEGLSYREAASELEVPVGTVMSRLHRGRRLLAALLEESRAEPADALRAAA